MGELQFPTNEEMLEIGSMVVARKCLISGSYLRYSSTLLGSTSYLAADVAGDGDLDSLQFFVAPTKRDLEEMLNAFKGG